MGIFEPSNDVAFMNGYWPNTPIQQSGKDVTIDSHIVSMTQNLDLLTLYKSIRRELL